jgi:hypothetical protein
MADPPLEPRTLRARTGTSTPLLWPLQAIEWVLEWMVYWLKRTALVQLLEIAAAFSIVFAAAGWLFERTDRKRQRMYDTWAVLSSGLSEKAHGARNEALAELSEDGFSMAGIVLPDTAWMEGIDLRGADLRRAKLRNAVLVGANLGCRGSRCTNLSGADLRQANLAFADLRGADLAGAYLTSANLGGACLDGATLASTVLDSSTVYRTDFRNTTISGSEYSHTVGTEDMGSFQGSIFYESGPNNDTSGGRFEAIAFRHGANPWVGEMVEDEVYRRLEKQSDSFGKIFRQNYPEQVCDTPLAKRGAKMR